jgi:O-antigen ligase
MRPFAASIAVLIAGVILFIALQVVGGFGGVSSEVATLNSRRNLWSLSWAGIQEKPWFGWGWMAAWQTDEFFGESSSWLTWGSLWSHNGYHDVLLGGGSIAGVLFLGYLWFATRSFSQYPVQFTAPRLTLAGFALVASTQESFFIGSHFVWALLVAALAPIRAVSRLGEGPTRTS